MTELDKSNEMTAALSQNDLSNIPMYWNVPYVLHLVTAMGIFAFGFFVFMGALYYRGATASVILRIAGLPLVVITAVFLTIVGYNRNELTTVMGLLGTIAGYLMHKGNDGIDDGQGRAPKPSNKASSSNQKSDLSNKS